MSSAYELQLTLSPPSVSQHQYINWPICRQARAALRYGRLAKGNLQSEPARPWTHAVQPEQAMQSPLVNYIGTNVGFTIQWTRLSSCVRLIRAQK